MAGILEHGHEVGHHTDLHRTPGTLSADEERRDFEHGLSTLTDLGATVRGFRAALWQATQSALNAAAEFGMSYDSSLLHDDRPYAIEIGGRRLVELPVHWSLDDWEQYGYLPGPDIGRHVETPDELRRLWNEELGAQRWAGGLCITTAHPFLSGRAARVEALRRFVAEARASGDVWIAPLGEIADRAAEVPTIAVRKPAGLT